MFILKLEKLIFILWYRFYASRKYNNMLRAVMVWNSHTKFLNQLRFKNNEFGALMWQR